MAIVCSTCGNDMGGRRPVCPYCGAPVSGNEGQEVLQPGPEVITVNLEAGRPIVDVAMKRFRERFELAKRQQTRVMVIIHGYGSSGTGGAIREAVRQRLEGLHSEKAIRQWLAGESFTKNNKQAAALMRRYQALSRDRSLRGNRGISIAVLA